jgi:hypothetical protein
MARGGLVGNERRDMRGNFDLGALVVAAGMAGEKSAPSTMRTSCGSASAGAGAARWCGAPCRGNARNARRIDQERTALKHLPTRRTVDYEEVIRRSADRGAAQPCESAAAQAVGAEVAALLSCHADRLTADGHQRWCATGIFPNARS